MRVSAELNDPSYSFAYLYLEVYLDGEQVHGCVTADEERGEAICCVPMSVIGTSERMPLETRQGKVEIRVAADAPAWVHEHLEGLRLSRT